MATTEAETPVESAKVSDEEVRQAIKDLLKDIDIALTSIREIRTLLQAKLGDRFDVEERKDFVKDTVASFLLEGDDEDEDQDPSEADEAEDDENEESVPTAVEVASPDKGKKKGGGFAKPLLLADELAEFMGSKIASRTDVTKKIWEYIKANDLQNPSNRREILCDEAFEKLMKRKKINMFKMTQVLNPMMKRMQDLQAGCLSDGSDDDDTKGKAKKTGKGTKRKASVVKVKKESKAVKREVSSSSDEESNDEGEDDDEEASPAKKRAKRSQQRNGAVIKDDPVKKVKANIKVKRRAGSDNEGGSSADEAAAPKGSNIYVHPDLLAALGVTEIATRPQLVKKMWEYIRSKDLQNPADRREIVLDDALKAVFKVNKFTAFSMNRYLNNVVKKIG